MSIISRYLLRETARTWLGVVLVLYTVLLGGTLSRILSRAASGEFDREVLLGVLGATTVSYFEILIPISLLLSILLVLGRLYYDNEMAVIRACGIGPGQLYRPFLLLALALALLTAVLSLEISPSANAQADYLRRQGRQTMTLGATESGQFRLVRGGAGAFYVESMSEDEGTLQNVFVWLQDKGRIGLVYAERGFQRVDRVSGERSLVLEDGRQYEGSPGGLEFRITRFAEYGLRAEIPPLEQAVARRDATPTRQLLASADRRDIAELQRRLSQPLLVIMLALIAVPLARTTPRQGRYAKLVYGLLVYLVYTNLLSASQLWIRHDQIPPIIGMWWVHVAMLAVVAWLLLQQTGRIRWWPRMRMRGKAA